MLNGLVHHKAPKRSTVTLQLAKTKPILQLLPETGEGHWYYYVQKSRNQHPCPEAEAINWAVHHLVSHNIHKAIVESDAKVCIEAMLESSSRPPWRIEVLTADTLSLAHRINSLEFKWTPREANMAAHVLTSWSLTNRVANCFVLVFWCN